MSLGLLQLHRNLIGLPSYLLPVIDKRLLCSPSRRRRWWRRKKKEEEEVG
jgi:hypothetical protein